VADCRDRGKTLLSDISQESVKEIAQILERLSCENLSALVQGFSALINASEPYLENRDKAVGTASDNSAE
jgi:hypothetical protein